MLKYIGYINPNDPADREALHGVPARDLTDDEVGDRRDVILASGLYRDTSRHASPEPERPSPVTTKAEAAIPPKAEK